MGSIWRVALRQFQKLFHEIKKKVVSCKLNLKISLAIIPEERIKKRAEIWERPAKLNMPLGPSSRT